MSEPTRSHNLSRLMQRRLPPRALELLRLAADLAKERGVSLYLVGGVVRDLLLGRETLDLDLVVEGDAHALARDLALKLGGRAVTHEQFGTAKLVVSGLNVDVAMARVERYPEPGALPEVRPGTIHDDLKRRDFTLNAIAVALAPGPFGQVLDPLGGQRDLRAKLVRVLHNRSFIDDPTRMLRAVRYQARFRFALGEQTRAMLLRDAARLAAVSPDRVRHEIERILAEPAPERALAEAAELGLLAAVHPALRFGADHARWFARAREERAASSLVYLALVAYGIGEEQAQSLAQRLALSNAQARPLLDAARLAQRLPALAEPSLLPSQIDAALAEFDEAAIVACRVAAGSPIIEGRLRLYLDKLRSMRPELDGEAVMELGAPSGPLVGQALEALRRARLDGEVGSRDEETAYLRRWLEQQKR